MCGGGDSFSNLIKSLFKGSFVWLSISLLITHHVGVINVEVIEQGESTTVSVTVAADIDGVVVVVNAVVAVNAWCGWWMIGGVFGLVGLGMVRGSQKTTPRVGLSRAGLDLKRGLTCLSICSASDICYSIVTCK